MPELINFQSVAYDWQQICMGGCFWVTKRDRDIISSMSEAYERQSIFLAYSKWHYGEAIKEIFEVTSNFLWFVANFFSFKLLIKTIFAPWKRLGESYIGEFNLGALASTFIVNSLMRIVGFGSRFIVLGIGMISYFLVLILALCVLVIWLLAPLILLGSLILSATFFAI